MQNVFQDLNCSWLRFNFAGTEVRKQKKWADGRGVNFNF